MTQISRSIPSLYLTGPSLEGKLTNLEKKIYINLIFRTGISQGISPGNFPGTFTVSRYFSVENPGDD